jgi:predicted transcriptional regulator
VKVYEVTREEALPKILELGMSTAEISNKYENALEIKWLGVAEIRDEWKTEEIIKLEEKLKEAAEKLNEISKIKNRTIAKSILADSLIDAIDREIKDKYTEKTIRETLFGTVIKKTQAIELTPHINSIIQTYKQIRSEEKNE